MTGSRPASTVAGRRLAELAAAVDVGPLPANPALLRALAVGRRRRRWRRIWSAVVTVALVLALAVVRHQDVTASGSGRRAAREAARSARTARADLVRTALSKAAPGMPGLDFSRADLGPATAVPGTPAVSDPASVRDDEVGVVPFVGRPGTGDVMAYRVTTRSQAAKLVDPCTASIALPLISTLAALSDCEAQQFASGDGLVVRSASQVQTDDFAIGGQAPAVERVSEAVLVRGFTTYSLAQRRITRASSASASSAVEASSGPLDDGQLALALRYVVTAERGGGPGLATAQLVSRATIASALASTGSTVAEPIWTARGAESAATVAGSPRHRLLDLLEVTGLHGAGVPDGVRLGYRVVRAAGPAGPDVCSLAAVVSSLPDSSCGVVDDDRGRWAFTERSGATTSARQVTLLVGGAQPARWVSVAVTGPGGPSGPPGAAGTGASALPLTIEQLLGAAQALAAADPT